jgi:hypothetical protein
MRDYRNAKVMAQTLRDDLSERSLTLSHSESLELVAHMLGLRSWNVLAAKIDVEHSHQPVEAAPVEEPAATPRVCSFCGKTQHEVAKLIAGPTAFICDACVGFCSDVLIDHDPGYANLTRDSLVSKSAEELILFRASIRRNLSRTRRIREAIELHVQNATSIADAKLSPQVALFLRKSPAERRAYVSEIESRIGSMERAIATASELLDKNATARKSGDA